MTVVSGTLLAGFMTLFTPDLRTGPTPPPAPVLLRVRAPTCWPAGRAAYTTSTTTCRRETRDIFRASRTDASSGDARKRAATVRSHFPADTRPRFLRWRRHRRAPGVLSSGRAG